MSRVTLLRGRVERFLLDSYTRDLLSTTPDDPLTVLSDESTDDWGNPETTEGGLGALSKTAVPCMFIDAGEPIMRSGAGTLILEKPVILVSSTDPVRIGDQARNICDRDGNVRMVGPGVVEDVIAHGAPGYPVLKMCTLRFAESV